MSDLIDTPKNDKLCFIYCGDACDCEAKAREEILRQAYGPEVYDKYVNVPYTIEQLKKAAKDVPEHWFKETYVIPDK